jgi:transposase-like protein
MQGTYLRMLQSIVSDRRFKIDSFMLDFEKSSYNAFSKAFPQAKVKGCYFHFRKGIWRNIQKQPEILFSIRKK